MNTPFTTGVLAAFASVALLMPLATEATTATALADQPVFSITSVPGNVALALSVEFPTAISVAHQGAFTAGTKYIGYFDPAKCYRYFQDTEADDTKRSHFFPVGSTTTDYKCTATGLTDTWSGSFLNWLMMQAIDPFKQSLTGGYRRVDTPTTTILERTWATDNTNNGSDTNFPLVGTTGDSNPLKNRPSPSSTDIADHTPLTLSSLKVSVRRRGDKVVFTSTGSLDSNTTDIGTHYKQSPQTSPVTVSAGNIYHFYARVKVCEAGTGFSRETNCVQYSEGWKPEGLLQQYAEKMRFSAFGYLNDPTDDKRDGGVMRARQKFVGPRVINPGSNPSGNSASEWNSTTGVMAINPDSADATATTNAYGVTVSNSGVMNYVNKFGQEQKTYKRRDPVSELYYGVLRYLKNQGPVPDWTAGLATDTNKVRLIDGFPVITNWDDPLQYSCQRNFVLGIGDTNTNWDRNLPGATTNSNEPTKPQAVTDDTSVNAQTRTDKVGTLHGNSSSLGTASISNGSYLIAGLAYDANTVDIRPDDASKPQTAGKQTVKTYWLDVLEFATYVKDNQYYLASKYGGFTVPNGFNPSTQSSDIAQSLWSTTGQTVGSGSTSQPKPDTYFTVAQADQMASGLKEAFARIASDMKAYTTSFSTTTTKVSTGSTASYSTSYDASSWSGNLVASTVTFDSSGQPSNTDAWTLRDKLATQASGTGWDTARRIVTWNPSTKAGVAFRTASLTTDQVNALNTSYVSGDDSTNYLKYLRGDTTNEVGSSATGGTRAYRTRDGLVGDIVNSKARPIGPPSAAYGSANAGYSTFKTTWASRPTVVYVGTNGGMLHAVNGATTGTGAGAEIFAYVPNMLFQGPGSTPNTNGLASLGNPSFEHHAMVDGSVTVADIDFSKTVGGPTGNDWRSVLIGAMGKGGKGYYAIDVTDPAGMTTEATVAGKVLWEFTHTDLGYTYGEPVVVKTAKYGWVVIFGSGYNNSDGKGYIFIVNPRTGALLEKLATGTDGTIDTGLAHLQAYVLDRTDGTADAVYGGDLLGNVWRLDLRGTSSYSAPTRIASLLDSSGNPLSITSRPLIIVQPGTNIRWVTLGTGRLLASSDTSSTQSQGLFAIKDGTGLTPGSASGLPSGVSYPVTKANLKQLTDLTKKIAIDTSSQVGWYYELGTGTGGLGWRVLLEPTGFNGVVAFTAVLPSGEACNPSGTNRVYAIDLGTGQSKLTSNGTTIAYSTTLSGVADDLRFYSVSSEPRLIACNEKGECKNVEGNWKTELGVRRLNWRELPTAD